MLSKPSNDFIGIDTEPKDSPSKNRTIKMIPSDIRSLFNFNPIYLKD